LFQTFYQSSEYSQDFMVTATSRPDPPYRPNPTGGASEAVDNSVGPVENQEQNTLVIILGCAGGVAVILIASCVVFCFFIR